MSNSLINSSDSGWAKCKKQLILGEPNLILFNSQKLHLYLNHIVL